MQLPAEDTVDNLMSDADDFCGLQIFGVWKLGIKELL